MLTFCKLNSLLISRSIKLALSVALLTSSIWLVSCKECETLTPQPQVQPINFISPIVGQKSTYILFSGDNYFDSANFHFSYYAAYLTLEIIGQSGGKYTIQEKVISDTALIPKYSVIFPDSTFTYYFEIRGDSLVFTGDTLYFTSNLLAFMDGRRFLWINDFTAKKVNLRGWKPVVGYVNIDSAYTVNAIINNHLYDRLNVYINNGAMMRDGPGYTYIYSKMHGLVEVFSVNPWMNNAIGWQATECH